MTLNELSRAARLRGVEEATGETFTILDSHIEVERGWLEPIMQRIGEEPTHIIMPQIDSTDPVRPLLPAQALAHVWRPAMLTHALSLLHEGDDGAALGGHWLHAGLSVDAD